MLRGCCEATLTPSRRPAGTRPCAQGEGRRVQGVAAQGHKLPRDTGQAASSLTDRLHPAGGAAVGAEEVEDAVEGNDAVDESGGEVGGAPRLVASAQGEPDDEELFDGGEEHGGELQPGPEG